MAMVTIQTLLICSLGALAFADLHGPVNQGFLMKSPKVHVDAIQHELTGVLSEVLGQGHGVSEDRLEHINATLLPIFRSLPKNNRGQVSEPIMRYALRRYFSATHGWMLKGFEEHGEFAFNAKDSDMDILQSKVPGFVRSALEKKFAHQGFSLQDMLSIAAVVESLSFNDVVRSVELSFQVNKFVSGAILSEAQLQEVLGSYVLIEMLYGATDARRHEYVKSQIYEFYPNWDDAMTFVKDIIGSDGFVRDSTSNPFNVSTFTFGDVARMAGMISGEFGVWSNYECQAMKDLLSQKDVHATGRVRLSDFYRFTKDEAWQFKESAEHLRKLGALDESSEYLGPQVIIPNYISGMSNCVTSTSYFAICCLNECDLIYQHIEKEISSPSGSVSQILEALDSLPTSTVISQEMIRKLQDIATIDGGSIPLHGRLFAQWLHFAFPRDCPYPHAVGSISPVMKHPRVSDSEMMSFVEHETASRDPSPDAGTGMWNFQETIMDFSTPSDTDDAIFSKVVRVSMQTVIIVAFAALLIREGIRKLRTSKGDAADAKKSEYKV